MSPLKVMGSPKLGCYMKRDQEAIAQYNELTEALTQIGAGWLVSEVEEVLSRGKVVAFRDLSNDEQILYEQRLNEETDRGLKVGKAKPSDTIGVPYSPEERLTILVNATQRVVGISDHSHVYVAEFAARHNMHNVILEQPIGADAATPNRDRRAMPMAVPGDVEERLNALTGFLNRNVLD